MKLVRVLTAFVVFVTSSLLASSATASASSTVVSAVDTGAGNVDVKMNVSTTSSTVTLDYLTEGMAGLPANVIWMGTPWTFVFKLPSNSQALAESIHVIGPNSNFNPQTARDLLSFGADYVPISTSSANFDLDLNVSASWGSGAVLVCAAFRDASQVLYWHCTESFQSPYVAPPAPQISSATLNSAGNSISIAFDQQIGSGGPQQASAFTVKVNGQTRTFTATSWIPGATNIQLSLSGLPVDSSAQVTLDYASGPGGIAANSAPFTSLASFTNRAVTNNSTVAPAAPQSPLATPTLGTGAGQISVRVGTVNGQPGVYNTQFLLGGNPYSWPNSAPNSAPAGGFVLNGTGLTWSTGSNPHTLTLYSGTRPNSIGGTLVTSMYAGVGGTQASVNFTPGAGAAGIVVCWSVLFYATSQSTVPLTICSTNSSNSGSGSGAATGGSLPAPKYSGPEFSSFGAPVLAGNKLVSEGKRLDGITSLKVNGQTVTYKINSDSQLEIDVPSNLAPGQYDVEITSAHGKLTHLKAFTVKAVVPTKDHAFKADGGWFNYGDLLALTNTAKTIGDEYTSVKCIVNGADAAVAERLAKRACDYIGANRLRGKAISHETKSTFTGSGYWVRVIANG